MTYHQWDFPIFSPPVDLNPPREYISQLGHCDSIARCKDPYRSQTETKIYKYNGCINQKENKHAVEHVVSAHPQPAVHLPAEYDPLLKLLCTYDRNH